MRCMPQRRQAPAGCAAGALTVFAIAVTDPEIFAGAFTWEGHWVRRPGEVVGRYACTVE